MASVERHDSSYPLLATRGLKHSDQWAVTADLIEPQGLFSPIFF